MSTKEILTTLIKEYGGTQQSFARIIGVTQPSVANWIAKDNIPERGIALIMQHCPEVDLDWLKGRTDVPEHRSVNMSAALTGAPFYPYLPASAGQLEMGDEDHSKERINIPGIQAEAFFPVTGSSMDPTIENGDIIGVKRLDSLERIRPNDIYLIFTTDSERMVKRIRSVDPAEAWLTLHSDNPVYEPFLVLKSQIASVYRVICLIRKF
ncbi:MAG: helix-turn-helix transcriptional regulator [Bacteroidaceae bacterium]|nr:helix-turn-helix transcriptional regulator [Bacteroidaceae bacterium]